MRRALHVGLSVALLASSIPVRAEQTVGLFLDDEGSYRGYTLFAPLNNPWTYLIDNDGQLVHAWYGTCQIWGTAYLLEDGSLLRACLGRVQRVDWDSNVLWDFVYSDDEQQMHHDIEPLPNGNVLMIAWEFMTGAEAVALGLDPENLDGPMFHPDKIVEVEPAGATGGSVVWEWRARDHLIQDFDPTKPDYGVVADNPQLVDINTPGFSGSDWLHANAVDYNPELDQIVLSASGVNEIWIIDHGTTTAEAAGHTGGSIGRGGDLLYRWGNPQNYDRGDMGDLQLLFQHDSRWVEPGLPGAGNITIFNNHFERVDEIVPPLVEDGSYALEEGQAYGPAAPVWSHATGLSSPNMSGAHRLPNGNTLMCIATGAIFREVTPQHELVWHYVSPLQGNNPMEQCETGNPTPVFRNHRYPPDHPAFAGRDLTPLGPLEQYNPPPPVPDGTGDTSPLTVLAPGTGAGVLRVIWDAASCDTAAEHHLLYGDLHQVASYALEGAVCEIGVSGHYIWSGVPAGDLFFLVVGVDPQDCYESSWGVDSSGNERHAAAGSGLCGATLKDTSVACP